MCAEDDRLDTKRTLSVGRQIRALRKARGISLSELSQPVRLSIGMLSQIERDLSTPSLNSLARIATALAVPVTELFDARTNSDVRMDGKDKPRVLRRQKRKRVNFPSLGLTKEMLSPLKSRDLELILVTLQPNGSSSTAPYSHDGEEAGLVLSGRMSLWVDGKTYHLNEGDTFQFASNLPHRFWNAGKEISSILWVLTSPEFEENYSD